MCSALRTIAFGARSGNAAMIRPTGDHVRSPVPAVPWPGAVHTVVGIAE
jgi:uncharacterized membrane protein